LLAASVVEEGAVVEAVVVAAAPKDGVVNSAARLKQTDLRGALRGIKFSLMS
jgi:hypothetical protein